ncbi:hypothetical protein BESB_068910 [Besnoitia besnoiti]|uniref:Sodium:neurotransmitter symporter family protein n=1 Tax=Besnoitia besnoiti TaxID=94643 RepID=A0A2A9M8Q3_BESBE|nr:hypothetical protein BESB_068910 [Besnoitia besnoiti]PFH34858.1 hypothetical protein BESB_068910 [Besnoitia besnoiti]
MIEPCRRTRLTKAYWAAPASRRLRRRSKTVPAYPKSLLCAENCADLDAEEARPLAGGANQVEDDSFPLFGPFPAFTGEAGGEGGLGLRLNEADAGRLQAELSVPAEQLLLSFSSQQGTRHFRRRRSARLGQNESGEGWGQFADQRSAPSPGACCDRTSESSRTPALPLPTAGGSTGRSPPGQLLLGLAEPCLPQCSFMSARPVWSTQSESPADELVDPMERTRRLDFALPKRQGSVPAGRVGALVRYADSSPGLRSLDKTPVNLATRGQSDVVAEGSLDAAFIADGPNATEDAPRRSGRNEPKDWRLFHSRSLLSRISLPQASFEPNGEPEQRPENAGVRAALRGMPLSASASHEARSYHSGQGGASVEPNDSLRRTREKAATFPSGNAWARHALPRERRRTASHVSAPTEHPRRETDVSETDLDRTVSWRLMTPGGENSDSCADPVRRSECVSAPPISCATCPLHQVAYLTSRRSSGSLSSQSGNQSLAPSSPYRNPELRNFGGWATAPACRQSPCRALTHGGFWRSSSWASIDAVPRRPPKIDVGCRRRPPTTSASLAVSSSCSAQPASSASLAHASPEELFLTARRNLYRQAIGEFRACPFYRHVAGIFSDGGAMTRRDMERDYIYRATCYTSSNYDRDKLPALQEAVVRLSGGMQLEVAPEDYEWAEQNRAIASRTPEDVLRVADLLEYPRMLSTLDEETVNWLELQRAEAHWIQRICLYILCMTVLGGTRTMDDVWAAVLEYDCIIWVTLIYAVSLFIVCLPIMAFELAIGEVTRASAPSAYWSLCKRARGLGLFMCLLILTCELVPYSRFPAECLVYLAESFRHAQPWKLTADEVQDCRKLGINESLCHARSYCVFSEQGYCVPYPIGKSAVLYNQRFGYKRPNSFASPYHHLAVLNSFSPSAFGLQPRTEALAQAVRMLPPKAAPAAPRKAREVRHSNAWDWRPVSAASSPGAEDEDDRMVVREKRRGSEESAEGVAAVPPLGQRAGSDAGERRARNARSVSKSEAARQLQRFEQKRTLQGGRGDGTSQTIEHAEESTDGGAPRAELAQRRATRRAKGSAAFETQKPIKTRAAPSQNERWGVEGPDFQLLACLVGTWLMTSYFFIAGGSTVSIVCAGVLFLCLVLSFGEVALSSRFLNHFLDGADFIRPDKALRAIGSPSVWTTGVLTAVRDVSVGLGIFCTLGGHARIGQNVMAEATGAMVTNVTASVIRLLLVVSTVSFLSRTLGISARVILQDAPVAHISIIYPVAVLFSEPFERVMGIALFAGATILLCATLSILLHVLTRALQDCELLGSFRKRPLSLALLVLLPLSLPQATVTGRYIVSKVKKYVGCAGHLWCCFGITVFLGWCYGVNTQAENVGHLAVYLYALTNWLALAGFCVLWLQLETIGAFVAYCGGCLAVAVASAYVVALCAPVLQRVWEETFARSADTPRAPARHLPFSFCFFQDRMWWLLVGNIEVLRVEFARVVSGPAAVCGFNVGWSVSIKWLAPYTLAPSLVFLASHHFATFASEILQDPLDAWCFGIACTIWTFVAIAFFYFLLFPDGAQHLLTLPQYRLVPLTKLPDNLGPAPGRPPLFPHLRMLFSEFFKDTCSPTARMMAYMYCTKASSLLSQIRREQSLWESQAHAAQARYTAAGSKVGTPVTARTGAPGLTSLFEATSLISAKAATSKKTSARLPGSSSVSHSEASVTLAAEAKGQAVLPPPSFAAESPSSGLQHDSAIPSSAASSSPACSPHSSCSFPWLANQTVSPPARPRPSLQGVVRTSSRGPASHKQTVYKAKKSVSFEDF